MLSLAFYAFWEELQRQLRGKMGREGRYRLLTLWATVLSGSSLVLS